LALVELDQYDIYIGPEVSEGMMRVSVSEAKAQLTELLRRAEAGDEVLITRHGRVAGQIIPAKEARREGKDLRAVIAEIQASARAKITPGPCAARSQDFLYDENGLPK
jgi:prevent-host-death family protein